MFCSLKVKSRWGDLNPRSADYESAAIPLSHSGKKMPLIYSSSAFINI
jgi:hypothetical protein